MSNVGGPMLYCKDTGISSGYCILMGFFFGGRGGIIRDSEIYSAPISFTPTLFSILVTNINVCG